MKKRYFFATVAATCMLSLSSCNGFLDQTPDRILNNDQVYGDPNLIKSILANYYGRVTFGQRLEDVDAFSFLDEAIVFNREARTEQDRNWWRIYDYGLIRNINQFLKGLKESTVLSETEKAPLEGEARLIRAWCYFCTCRALGGMPNVGDNVFTYTPGMDINTLQTPRATEAAMYDYIISECHEIADQMETKITTHSARANKWTAKMLEARAALYAASLAQYNTVEDYPLLRTEGGEVGIPANKATGYYQQALEAADEVIKQGPFELVKLGKSATLEEMADNFYKAICVKEGNKEVIWARDYAFPGQTHGFTRSVQPKSIEQDNGSSRLSALLNLAEAFEPIDTDTPGKGAKFETGTLAHPIFFDRAIDPFANRDPRLNATLLYPGSTFSGKEIVLQGGQLVKEADKWKIKTAIRGTQDTDGHVITALNGPYEPADDRECNRTGFYIRKFLDTAPSAGTGSRGSEMWNPYFRISEAYLIAAEASFALSGSTTESLGYINQVRERAGVKALTTLTFENIVHENQVEFAFEDHRQWDLKRWRLADKIWDGNSNNPSAQHRGLWPYRVVADGDPNNGKWVFFEKNMTEICPNPLRFEAKHYYANMDGGWLNNNPKLVKNPYE